MQRIPLMIAVAFLLGITPVAVLADDDTMPRGEVSTDRELTDACRTLAEFYATTIMKMNYCQNSADCISIPIKNSYGCHQLVNRRFIGFEAHIYDWDRGMHALCGLRLEYPKCAFGVPAALRPLTCTDGICVCAHPGC